MRRTPLGITLVLLVGLISAPVTAAGSAPAPEPQTRREVFGWFLPGGGNYMLNVVDWNVLTTAAFFSIDSRADGSLVTTTSRGTPTREWNAWNSDWVTQTIDTAHAHGAKVVLTVTRFGWDAQGRETTIALLSNPDAIARLADEIATAVVTRGADGVNIDLEPMIGGYQDEFVALLAAIRAEFDEREAGLQLTFDSVAHNDFLPFPVAAAVTTGGADAVVIMGYDFNRSSSRRAGSTAPMGGAAYNVPDAVADHLAQAPAGKVILAYPNYGRSWPTRTDQLHSLTRINRTRFGYPSAVKMSSADALAATHGRLWDPEHLSAWTRWRGRGCAACRISWWQMYYDDAEALSAKYDFVIEQDLAGVGMWRLGSGWDRPGYWDLLASKFAD
jgi:spore germination protein